MTTADKIRDAIDTLAGGTKLTGSDDCECVDCEKKRAATRTKVVQKLMSTLADMGA